LKLVIMIPCFNEESVLPVAMAALPRSVRGFSEVEILVIGDGCSDRTIDVARAAGATRAHDRGHHAGLAATFREGMALAREMGADVVVNFDADNQYPAEKIPELTAPILRGDADVVIGERTFARMHPFKRYLQRSASRIASLIAGIKVSDVTSGFRAYNRLAMERTTVTGSYTYTMETTLNIRRAGLRLATLPVDSNADLRPSRLIRSNCQYVAQAIKTIALHLWERAEPVTSRLPAEWVLAVLTFLACGSIATFVFHGIPVAMDEYAYLTQARMFAAGKIYELIPDLHPTIRNMYFQWVEGKYFSKYAPGYPLFLSLGVLGGFYQLVNPLIAAITVFYLLRLVATFTSRPVAIITTGLVITNPYFWGYAASLYAHSLTLLCAVIAIYCVRRFQDDGRPWRLVTSGLACGIMFATRQLDAFCLIAPLAFLIRRFTRKRGGAPQAIRFIEPFAAITACLLAYNYALSGRISLAAYPAFASDFILVPASHGNGTLTGQLKASAVFWFSNLSRYGVNLFTVQYVGFACFGLPALAVAGFLSPGRWMWKWFFTANLALLVFLYFFHNGPGWPMYGSRYYYTTLVGIAVLAACGIQLFVRGSRGRLATLLGAVFLFQLAFGSERLVEYGKRFDKVREVHARINGQCPDGSIVILGAQPAIPKWPDYVYLYDFKRNALRPDNRLIVQNEGEFNSLKSRYPDRPPCRLKLD
jgi:hypothetical protein